VFGAASLKVKGAFEEVKSTVSEIKNKGFLNADKLFNYDSSIKQNVSSGLLYQIKQTFNQGTMQALIDFYGKLGGLEYKDFILKIFFNSIFPLS